MRNEPITLTNEKLKEIYISEKFRNEVAFAHSCLDKDSVFKYKSTCSYPIRYIVTEAQILEAKKELFAKQKTRLDSIRKDAIKKIKNDSKLLDSVKILELKPLQ